MSRGKQIDELVREDKKNAINDIISTAYTTVLSGYGIDTSILSAEARRRIQKTISDLADENRRTIENETQYKERLEMLAKVSPHEREKILRIAKEKHISLEKAYLSSSDASHN